jgi:hypothetical protein
MQRGLPSPPTQALSITNINVSAPPMDEQASEATPEVKFLRLTINSLEINLSYQRNLVLQLQENNFQLTTTFGSLLRDNNDSARQNNLVVAELQFLKQQYLQLMQNINMFLTKQLAMPELTQLQQVNTELQMRLNSLLVDEKDTPTNPQLLKKQNATLKGRLGMVDQQYKFALSAQEKTFILNAQLKQQNDDQRTRLTTLTDEKFNVPNVLEVQKQNEALQVALSNSKIELESKTAELQSRILALESKIRELQMELDQFLVGGLPMPNDSPVNSPIPLQQNLGRTNTFSTYNFFCTSGADHSTSPQPADTQMQSWNPQSPRDD